MREEGKEWPVVAQLRRREEKPFTFILNKEKINEKKLRMDAFELCEDKPWSQNAYLIVLEP